MSEEEGPPESDLGRVSGEKARFDYVKDGKAVTEYVKVEKDPSEVYLPTEGYHPTLLLGVCTKCRTIGNLEFPTGFDFKAGDRIMEGKVTKAMCLGCGKLTEFLPYHKLEGGGYGGPGWDFLKRSQKIVKEIGGIGE